MPGEAAGRLPDASGQPSPGSAFTDAWVGAKKWMHSASKRLRMPIATRCFFSSASSALGEGESNSTSKFIELCEKSRQEAFELMLQHAEQTGGNAVIGIRYDANEVMQGVTEVLCYGTAVVVEPVG